MTASSPRGPDGNSGKRGKSDSAPGGSGQAREPRQGAGQRREARESDGWRILSYMIGGMALYGFIGWLIGRWTGLSFLFPVGMIVGLALSIVLIIFRVTRP